MKRDNKSFLKKNILKFLIFNFSFLILTACGYKPSSQLIQNVFAKTVYVNVNVDKAEPENAPFIKDEMNRLVYTRFKGKIASEKEAENRIDVTYEGSTYLPLSYKGGYVTRYRASIPVRFDMQNKKGTTSKTIIAIVESDIESSSLTSSAIRTDSIRRGLAKALDEFLAYVSAQGMMDASTSK